MSREYELAVSTEREREGDDPDFDFLTHKPGKFRRPWNGVLLFRTAISVVLLILFILLVVNLTRGGESEELSLESANCLFPLGGGETEIGEAFDQPQTVTPECVALFREYFKPDGQYWKDTQTAIDTAVHMLRMKGNYSQMVVLDIDETSLSNLEMYQHTDFAPTPSERSNWATIENFLPIPATLRFYEELRRRGFSVVFITGRPETRREITESSLKLVGYGKQCGRNPAPAGRNCYFQLIMRKDNDNRDAVVYKSDERRKLKRQGFEIIADVGDQWSDLLGPHRPLTIVKMPNPLYYLP